MSFTIRQLEIFVQAADDENFRVTADRLGISQPTISKHIKSLERTAGGRLFDRQRGSSARLSSLGHKMVDQARLLLDEARKVSASARPESAAITIRMIAGPLIIDHLIKPNLREYYAMLDAPDLELKAVPIGEEAYSTLRSGKADIGLFVGDEPHVHGLAARLLKRVGVGIFACPEIARAVGTDREKISAAPWIMAPLNSPVNDWLKHVLEEVGVSPSNVVARPQFTEVSRDLTLGCRGMTVLLDTDAEHHVRQGNLVRLPMQLASGYRFMLTRAGPASPALAQAIAYWRAKLS